MGCVVQAMRRLLPAWLLLTGATALAQTPPAETGWPPLAAPRHAPCSVEWDDLGTPPCTRVAFEARYIRLSEIAVTAPACHQRDEAWARDLGATIGWLLAHPRPGTVERAPDAAAEARVARRLEAARDRARAALARNERQACDDIWESTRLVHADRLVGALRADRAAMDLCRAGTLRGPDCDRLRGLPR